MVRLFAVLALVFGSAGISRADEPSKEEAKQFQAPAPQALGQSYYANPLPRPGTREVWQYYGVDNRGRWVPRVILAPGGSYYYHDGSPFLYTTSQPTLYMPYVTD